MLFPKSIRNLLKFAVLSSLISSQTAMATDNEIVTIGGDNACQLNWGEVNSADPLGWNFTGDLGDRSDLHRVYYHAPSQLYLRISVAQRWNWNGKKAAPTLNLPELPDDNRFVPKITDYSHYGTGGYSTGEYLFALGLNTTAHDSSVNDGSNSLTFEFFQDAALTEKAQVNLLNFVTTDIDSGQSNTEQITVLVEDKHGNEPFLYFDLPDNTALEDSAIDLSNNQVMGHDSDISDSSGNVAPVVMGYTHKLSLIYELAEVPTLPSNSAVNRYTYISNLSWCGKPSTFPDDDLVDIMFAD